VVLLELRERGLRPEAPHRLGEFADRPLGDVLAEHDRLFRGFLRSPVRRPGGRTGAGASAVRRDWVSVGLIAGLFPPAAWAVTPHGDLVFTTRYGTPVEPEATRKALRKLQAHGAG